MRPRIFAVALVLVFGGMDIAWADPDLHLSAEQKAKYETLQKQHQPALQRLRQEISSQQQSLKAVFLDPKATPNQVQAALKNWADLKGKKAALEAGHLFELHQLLNPEQRKIYIQEAF